MFICTARSVTLISSIVGFEVYPIEKIISILPLDKNTDDSRIQGFFITSDDISSRSTFKKFTEAMNSKNNDNIVIFVDKKRKGSTLPEGFPGVNYYYSLPSKEVLSSAFSEIISRSNISAATEEKVEEKAPSFETGNFRKPEEQETAGEDKVTFTEEIEIDTSAKLAEEVVAQMEEDATTEAEEIKRTVDSFPDVKEVEIDGNYLSRLSKATTTGELGEILQDVTIESLIKDISEQNATYAQVEDKLEGLNAAIYNIMSATGAGDTLEDKLRKVRGIVYDRASVNAYGTTIIESYVHRMLDTVLSTSMKYITEETEKITEAVKSANVSNGGIAALEALKANRYNAVLMLDTFLAELTNLENVLRGLTSETIAMFVTRENNITGNANINTDLRNKYATVVGETTVEAIKKLYEELNNMPDQFKQITTMVRVTRQLVYQVFENDKNLIDAYETIISRLTLNGVSQSQIAKQFTDKTVRVWVGDVNSGITIIPYLFSKTLEKENCNVLNIYIGDDYNLDAYGIKHTDLGTFVNEVPTGGFCTVAGSLSDVIMMEDVLNAIEKATPFYRVINVVMHKDMEQLMMLANKSFAVYVVQHPTISKASDPVQVFKVFESQHVMKFVVLNFGNKVTPEYFDQMGISNATDIMCAKIPILPDIMNASLMEKDPYEYSTVRQAVTDLRRYV